MKSPRPLEDVVELLVVEPVSLSIKPLLVEVIVVAVPWSRSAQRIPLDEMDKAVHTIGCEHSRCARKSRNGLPE